MGVKLQSSSGGSVEIAAPVTASNYTLTAPAATGTLVYTDASGNLGVGTSSPGARLHVAGSGSVTQFITSTNGGTIRLGLDSSGSIYNWIESDSTVGMRFATANIERMRLDASGNLLVGTTTSFSGGKLGIVFDGSVASAIAIQNSSTTANTVVFRNSSGATIGTITNTNTATAYNTSSDYRLKENVAPLTNALDKISALKPVTYNWKVDGSADRGFIAHELQGVIPQAVSGEKDAVDAEGNIMPQGVDYGKITPEIVAAIQEQQAMITELKAEIAEIKRRIA